MENRKKLIIITITSEEIELVLRSMKSSKAPGLGNLHANYSKRHLCVFQTLRQKKFKKEERKRT